MKVRPLRPEMVPKVEAWIDKWSKYEAFGGGTLPQGYMRYANADSLADQQSSFEKGEMEAAIKKYGAEEMSWNPWSAYNSVDSPITVQFHDELEDASGYNDVDAHTTLLAPFFEEADRVKKLAGI